MEPGAPPLQLENLPPQGHTLTPAEQAQVQRDRVYRQALRVATLEARWGPAMSTPGVSISLVETGRAKTASGHTLLTWRISGAGFRAGEKLTLVRWPLSEALKTVMGGLVLNAQGIAVCGAAPPAKFAAAPAPAPAANVEAPASGLSAAPTPQIGSSPPPPAAGPPSCADTMQPNQPVRIQATVAPGEAVRVALVGEDRGNRAFTEAVPFPIADTDKGCRLQVLLGLKDADLVVVQGTGFPPNSEVKIIQADTGGKTYTLKSQTNSDGHLAIALMPGITGQPAGGTTIRYAGVVQPPSLTAPAAPQAPDSACAPAVSFRWGQGTYKPE
jgi:hypothetical protein